MMEEIDRFQVPAVRAEMQPLDGQMTCAGLINPSDVAPRYNK